YTTSCRILLVRLNPDSNMNTTATKPCCSAWLGRSGAHLHASRQMKLSLENTQKKQRVKNLWKRYLLKNGDLSATPWYATSSVRGLQDVPAIIVKPPLRRSGSLTRLGCAPC